CYASRLFVVLAEDDGYFGQVGRLAALLPPDDVILARGWTEWITPLYLSFDRRVVPLNLDTGSKGRALLKAWVAQRSAERKPVYLAIEGLVDLSGFQVRPLGDVMISRVFSEPTMTPLPRTVVTKNRDVQLYEIRPAA